MNFYNNHFRQVFGVIFKYTGEKFIMLIILREIR